MVLTLYGNLGSQPTRAVAWLLVVQRVEYEFVSVAFGGAFIKSDEFRQINPNEQIPALVDGAFSLFEGNAILTYVADKFGWHKLYPTELQARANVDKVLHWHHTHTRQFTLQIVRPLLKCCLDPSSTLLNNSEMQLLRHQLGSPTTWDVAMASNVLATRNSVLCILEEMLTADYVAQTTHVTVADYALYCEFDQLDDLQLLIEMENYPRTVAWLARMKQLPFHDEIRQEMHVFHRVSGLI